MVTRVVAFGATALAVLAGVVFAQQASGSTESPSTTSDNPSAQLPDTGSDGSWTPPQAPGVDSGGSGPAHGSSGGS